MPTVTILGYQVWIPDFSDLVNAVTGPLRESVTSVLSGIQDRVWPLLQNLQGQISSIVKTLVDPLWNFLQGMSGNFLQSLNTLRNDLFATIQRIISQGFSNLVGIGNVIVNAIKPALDQLLQSIQPLAQIVLQGLQPWVAAIRSLLEGHVAPLLDQIFGAMVFSTTLIGSAIPALQQSSESQRIQLDAIRAQIQANPVETEKIFAAKINEIFNPLATLAQDVWKGLQAVFSPIISQISNAILGALNYVVQSIVNVFYNFPKTGMEIWPQGSFARSVGGMIGGMVAFNAAYVTITTLELLHPLKQVGLLRIIDATRALLGADTLGRMIAMVTFSSLYTTPLRYEMQSLFRPSIPDPRRADTMLFQGQLTVDRWHEIYSWHGFKEQHIQAWYNSMWLEPSDRMIVGLVEGGQVDLSVLRKILGRRGYNPETTAMILNYATRKALSDEISAIRGEINSAVSDGLIDVIQAEEELRSLGDFGDQLEFRLNAMTRRMERVDIKDQIEILTSQVKSDVITVQQYRDELIALGLRTTRIQKLVTKEEARRKPKVVTPKATKRDLATSTYVKFFVEGTINDSQLRNYLEALEPPLPKDRVDLLMFDARIQKAKAVAAAEERLTREERRREMSVDFYVRLYVEDLLNEVDLRRNLIELTPRLEPEDVTLTINEAKLKRTRALEAAAKKPERAEAQRDLSLEFYVRLYVEDLISESALDSYLAELTPRLARNKIDLVIQDARIRKAQVAVVKLPKPPPEERKRDLTIEFYVRLYVEDVFLEEDLRRYLGELKPPLLPDRLELVVTDAQIRKYKATTAAAA